MADLKISQLPAATTPLAGTEVLPVVQSSTTDKVSVANLTAGRTVSMLGATVTGLTASKPVFTDGSSNLTSSGTVPTTQGGTGLTSFTTNAVVYSSSTSALATGTALYFDGSKLGLATTSPSDTFGIGGTGGIRFEGWNADRTFVQQQFNASYFQRVSGDSTGRQLRLESSSGDGGTSGSIALRTSSIGTLATRVTIDGAGDTTLNTGNLIQGTAAKGFNFSANTPAAGKTSTLLNWYEEGTWTPSVGGNATYTRQQGYYTRIGRQVTIQCDMIINVLGTGSTQYITNAPFSSGGVFYAGSVSYWSSLTANYYYVTPMLYNTQIQFNTVTSAGSAINDSSTIFGNGARVILTMTYFV